MAGQPKKAASFSHTGPRTDRGHLRRLPGITCGSLWIKRDREREREKKKNFHLLQATHVSRFPAKHGRINMFISANGRRKRERERERERKKKRERERESWAWATADERQGEQKTGYLYALPELMGQRKSDPVCH